MSAVMDEYLKEGFVLKKKRKKGQGFARRYLTLTTTGMLAYSTAPKAAPRESCLASTATIGLRAMSKEMTLDFGHDLWLLRFLTTDDYEQWLANLRSCRATFNEMVAQARRSSGQLRSSTGGGSLRNSIGSGGNTSDAGYLDQSAMLAAVNKLAQPIQDLEQVCNTLKTESEQASATASLPNSQSHSKIKTLFGGRRPSSARPETAPQNLNAIPPSPSGQSHLSVHSAQSTNGNSLEQQQQQAPSSNGIVQKMAASLQVIQAQQKYLLDLLTQAASAQSNINRISNAHDMHANLAALARSNSIDSQSSFGGDTIFVDAPDEYDVDFEGVPEENYLDDVSEVDDFQSVIGSPTVTSPADSPQLARHAPKTDAIERRTKLPAGVSGDQVSLFGILKKAVGKDLSRISLPISFNEPLSALQRLAEEMECTHLLRQAAETQDPVERISLVAAFVVSGFASARFRTSRKPFNPLLGETFECLRPDKKLNFVAEKVCHRPVILASYAEDPDKVWTFAASSSMQEKFYGRSLEFTPTGQNRLDLPGLNENYSWKLPNTYLRNIMGGEKYLEHVGDLSITCSNGYTADLEFHSSSMWSSSGRNKLSGSVSNDQGEQVCQLSGRWDEVLGRSEDMHSKTWRELWRVTEPTSNPNLQYGFGDFTIELNEITPDIANCLPPTDSRFRPDQRAFEEGRVDEADQIKGDLEERQRQRREGLEQQNLVPRWFRKGEDGLYAFDKGSYFLHRERKEWEDQLQIFEL